MQAQGVRNLSSGANQADIFLEKYIQENVCWERCIWEKLSQKKLVPPGTGIKNIWKLGIEQKNVVYKLGKFMGFEKEKIV